MQKQLFSLALLIYLQIGGAFLMPSALAQLNLQTSELGGGIGGLNYKGEISPEYRLLNNMPALTVFYRRDVSKPLTLRASALSGFLNAEDNSIDEPLHQVRKAEMNGFLTEVSGGLEYNFLDYYDFNRQVRWTPYYFLNIAGFLASTSVEAAGNTFDGDNTIVSVSIPSGFGIKYALTRHWNLGFEAGARKTFTDLFDNMDGEDKQKGRANPYNKDWYFYNGFSISYTFYKILCPSPYNSNPSPLN